MDLFLGLDLGTSNLKVLVMTDTGAIVARGAASYPLLRPRPGWAVQYPGAWWAALVEVLADLRARAVPLGRVAAIGLSGQMHGLVLLDSAGNAVGPCQTWADARCAAEARLLERRVGARRLAAIAGSRANPSATAAKLLWMRRHDRDRWRAAAYFMLPKDYLRWRLTGALATDASDASGTLLCDITMRDWSPPLLAALGLPANASLPILASHAVTGQLMRSAAALLGLRAGIPVMAGGGDVECAAIGQGIVGGEADAGIALATLGTAGQFFAATERPLIATERGLQTLCHVVPDRWHVMGALLIGASAMDWLAGILAPPGGAPPAVAQLLDEAAHEPTGARGLLFVPYVNGTRMPVVDPAASGAFVGLRPWHTRASLARAVVEGVALALREGLEASRAAGIPIRRVRLAGGAQRHPLWARVQADAFGVPVELGAAENASALGAAMLAAIGSGAIASFPAAAALVAQPDVDPIEPDPAATALYTERAALLRTVTRQLRPTWRALAEDASPEDAGH